jgi:hypothetical protein
MSPAGSRAVGGLSPGRRRSERQECVESTRGAVALGRACLFPPLSSARHYAACDALANCDEALGFEREIYCLSEQAEMWLDSVDRSITEPVRVDKVGLVAANRAAKIKTDIGALIACGLDMDSPVA